MPLDRASPPYPLIGWLYYPEFDPALYPNFATLLEREGIARPPAVDIPFGCGATR